MKRIGALARNVLRARGGVLAMVQTAVAQGLTMGVNVATGIITARLLGPVGRGEFAAASLWLLLPSMLAIAGLQNAVIFGVRQRPDQAAGIGAASLVATTSAFLPLLLVALWLLPIVMHSYSANIVALARVALLLSIANVWMTMIRQWLLATHRYGLFNVVVYGVAMTYLALLLLLAMFRAVTPATTTYAQIGATGVALLLVITVVAAGGGRTPIQHIPQHLRALVCYGLRAAPIDVVTVLSQNVDRLVLVVLIPAAEFGLYVVALSFARILSILQTAVAAVMLADLAGRPPSEIAAFTRECFRLLLWLLLAGCAAVLLVDKPLLRLVYGPDFAGAVPVFRVLLFEAALSCLAQALIQAFLARDASGTASTIQVLCFVVTAVGVVLLAPTFGGIGAATALAGGSLLRVFLLLGALHRVDIDLPGITLRRSDMNYVLNRLLRRTPNTHTSA